MAEKKDFRVSTVEIIPPGPIVEVAGLLSGPVGDLVALLEALKTALNALETFLLDASNPLKSIFLQLLQEIENLLLSFRNAGVYSIFIPPPVNSIKDTLQEIQRRADAINAKFESSKATAATKGTQIKDDLGAFMDFGDPFAFVPGGLYRIRNLLSEAFLDPHDTNRPVFPSTGSNMGGIVLVMDSAIGNVIPLLTAFLKFLGLLLDTVTVPLESLDPPAEFNVESLPGRVRLTWRDSASIIPPRKYELLRSEYREGSPVSITQNQAVFPLLDRSNNPVYEFDIIKVVEVLSVFGVDDIAERLFEDTFDYEDTTGDEGKVYFYSIRKTWATSHEQNRARTDDKLTGKPSQAKPGRKLAAIVLDEDLKIKPTIEERESQIDRPFTNKEPFTIDEFFLKDELLDNFRVKGSDLTPLPKLSGRIKIGDEIMYYENIVTSDATHAHIFSVNRGRENTVITKHKKGAPIDILPSFATRRVSTEPDFLPPVTVASLFPSIGGIIDLVISVLRAIAEGFITATENLLAYLDALEAFIDNLINQLNQILALIEQIELDLSGLTVTAIILPVKKGGTNEIVTRIGAAFSSPEVPETSAMNIATAFGIFYGGPNASAIETIINSVFVKKPTKPFVL